MPYSVLFCPITSSQAGASLIFVSRLVPQFIVCCSSLLIVIFDSTHPPLIKRVAGESSLHLPLGLPPWQPKVLGRILVSIGQAPFCDPQGNPTHTQSHVCLLRFSLEGCAFRRINAHQFPIRGPSHSQHVSSEYGLGNSFE